MEKAYFYDTRLGRILIREDDEGITGLSMGKRKVTEFDSDEFVFPDTASYEICETELIKEAAGQLLQYLEGKRKEFNFRLNPKGTPFQLRVWNALLEIPYGETRSYGQIAEAIGNQKAARAVGMANHNNPIMIFIPCHRVIGANKELVGFGAGLDIKEQLLNIEKQSN